MDLEATSRSFQDSEGLLGAGLANALSRIARGRLWHRTPVTAFSQRVSLLGERKQSKSIDYIRAQSCELVGHGCNPAAPRLDCISRKPRGTRAVTRRRSEPSHSSAHRCKQCSRRRAPPPGRYSSSAFVIAPTASSTTRTEINRLGGENPYLYHNWSTLL